MLQRPNGFQNLLKHCPNHCHTVFTAAEPCIPLHKTQSGSKQAETALKCKAKKPRKSGGAPDNGLRGAGGPWGQGWAGVAGVLALLGEWNGLGTVAFILGGGDAHA